MQRLITLAAFLAVIGLSLTLTPPAWAKEGCAEDAVQVGPACIDKYEASVWSIPAAQTGLIAAVKRGKVTLTDLTAGGATQVSSPSLNDALCTPAFPGSFPETGNWIRPLYAVSIPGVHPTACVTWFQAEQACRLSGKRLLTNQEWQAAASGTPDPGTDNGTTDCAVASDGSVNTGSRSACVSRWGAFDMVGNIEEWVADWVPLSTTCAPALFGTGDWNCLAGASTNSGQGPGALIRGGGWLNGTTAGVFAVTGGLFPSLADSSIGFRCAR